MKKGKTMINETYHAVPSVLSDSEEDFIHALCYCCIPNYSCIKIPRNWPHKNGVYNFHCELCGLEGIVIIKKGD